LGGIAPLPPPGYAPGGNRILIAGYRPEQEFVIERSSCANRFGNSNQHNFQQSWQFSLHRKSVYYMLRTCARL